jgi:SAM-dependent methyltransferase
MMDYFESNRLGWDLRTEAHLGSEFYGLEKWKNDPSASSLTPIERSEVGEVRGRSLLHLQCHFGQDTLSWARLGAKVTGCDFSEKAIGTARQLATDLGHSDAQFVCCNVLDLPQHLDNQFDIVFTSYGTIGWLPDLRPWAQVVAHFLRPGGFFYMADFHPVLWMLSEDMTRLQYAYHNAGVIETDQTGTYADRDAPIRYKEFGWNHSISELLNSLLEAGLHVDFFNEFPYSPYDCFEKTIRGDDGNYRIAGLENIIPMVYSLRARNNEQ